MMQIYLQESGKIIKNKKTVEKILGVTLSVKDGLLTIKAKARTENELPALQVIEALILGFSITDALMLKEEGFSFIKIPIKEFALKKDAVNMRRTRARIIGSGGTAIENIESLTDCEISVHENDVGIIGLIENAKRAEIALKRLIAGSTHANVYAYLEKQRALEKQSF